MRGGNPEKSVQAGELGQAAPQAASVKEQVEQALLSFGTEEPATAMAAGRKEETTPWHFSNKLELPRQDFTMDAPQYGKKQVFSIRVDMQYDLYAATNPAYKYLAVKLLGAGFSAGNMVADLDYDRRHFQSEM